MRRARRRMVALLVIFPLALLAMAAVGTSSSLAAECKNESIREAQGSTFLPECRAWELVSPSGQVPSYVGGRSGDGNNLPKIAGTSASEMGERVAYSSLYPVANADTYGDFYLATRNLHAGWSVADAAPPLSTDAGENEACEPFVYFSQTLTINVLQAGFAAAQAPGGAIQWYKPCARDEPELVPGEPEGVANIFLRGAETYSTRLVDEVSAGVTPENAVFEGGSADLSHVLFGEAAKLLPGAPAGFDLYEWTGGVLRLVGYNQQGEAVEGAALADGSPVEVVQGHAVKIKPPLPGATLAHSVSSDGERVFFEAGSSLYLRENASRPPTPSGHCEAFDPGGACTVQIDAKQGGSEEGGGVFLYASADGSRVFFMDGRRLMADSTAKPGEPDLYEYDTEEPEGQRLKDLTVGSSGSRADVQGFTGASEDGSYFYFVADGALTGANREGVAPVSKQPNLYVVHNGALTFLATLDPETDARDWAANGQELRSLSSTISPDGEYLAFDSTRSLSGYDNEPVPAEACGSRRRCPEVFLYSVAEARISCASCNSSGRRPTGPSGLVGEGAFNGAYLPAYPQHRLFDEGQLFFESASGLVSEQSDGVAEVYEYRSGAVSLISSGQAEESVLAAVSANAQNVFFVSTRPLVAADTGGTPSLYDARVDGGFAEPPVPTECEAGEKCLGPLSAGPAPVTLGTPSFQGPGNPTPPPKQTTKPTRKQKLQRALKRCRTRTGKRRRHCEAAVRKRFGVKLTRRQKLKRALARCRKRRARCSASARSRLGKHSKRNRHRARRKRRQRSGKLTNHGQR